MRRKNLVSFKDDVVILQPTSKDDSEPSFLRKLTSFANDDAEPSFLRSMTIFANAIRR